MKRQLTVSEAKTEIRSLQSFVQLVESYQPETLQEEIYKTYAFTGSIVKTVTLINAERTKNRLPLIDSVFVTETIKTKPTDPLHRIMRTAYMTKTRGTRRK